MRLKGLVFSGLSVACMFWSCAALVDVDDDNTLEAGCIGCHANADALEKYTKPEEASSAGGG